jgi:outer membrane protein
VLKIEKKQVKIISVVVAVFFLLGVVGIALSQSGKSYAAGSSSNVGIVNSQILLQSLPDYAKAQQDFQAEYEQAKKDYDAKSATMNDKEKQEYSAQVQQRLALRQQELIGAINDKIVAAVKAVADSKGLTVVLDKSNVIYGGQDITDEVGKKLTGK